MHPVFSYTILILMKTFEVNIISLVFEFKILALGS